ncbi:UvrB/UvrC motif-containing protein [candidate division KSB1 bacterium]|nr:UvrB/UvrC motif-containing protein [candidate division KSB1 bacterium]
MKDIGPVLHQWPYRTHDLNVRLIEGQDGSPKLQMRLDLGILQMELDGRPDGKRPYNCDSYLSYYEKRIEIQGPMDLKPFRLTPRNCLHLQQESVQYYHRYLALMKLEDYPRVVRDTLMNLRLFDLVAEFCTDAEMVWSFEQYRPYVLMMNVRALASQYLRNKEYDQALKAIDEGMDRIREFHERHKERLVDRGIELDFLYQWAKEIRDIKPLSQRERLQRELDLAISREQYERAASLRDRLLKAEINGSCTDREEEEC